MKVAFVVDVRESSGITSADQLNELTKLKLPKGCSVIEFYEIDETIDETLAPVVSVPEPK